MLMTMHLFTEAAQGQVQVEIIKAQMVLEDMALVREPV